MPMPDDSPTGESVYDTPEPFQPFKPEPVQPNPSPASAEDHGGTSGEDGDAAPSEEVEPEPEPLPEFDPKHREAFIGVLYLGRLQETFTWLGHTFTIKTITTEESAAVGLLVEPHERTRSRNSVYQAAVLAAAVVAVDGKPLPSGLGPALDLNPAFNYVMTSWMPPVREHIFNKVFALEMRTRDVLAEMGNASG